MAALRLLFCVLFTFLTLIPDNANGAIPDQTEALIKAANRDGPYLGVVVPNLKQMNLLLQHSSYKPSDRTNIDVAGRRFRFGTIYEQKVIVVMTGIAMLNAGVSTQLLLSLFDVKGVVHYGLAGSVNPYLNIGDVAIAQTWFHHGRWYWQRHGRGQENGDYTTEYGNLNFASFATNVNGCPSNDNLLSNIWYQPEEIFPVDGKPEQGQDAFYVPVDQDYYVLTQKLLGIKLESCVNPKSCLGVPAKVTRELHGTSANIYLDNDAYSNALYSKFNVSPVDMESAAVALVCRQQNVPFIAFRGLSNHPGADSAADESFSSLAPKNTITVVVAFIKLMANTDVKLCSV